MDGEAIGSQEVAQSPQGALEPRPDGQGRAQEAQAAERGEVAGGASGSDYGRAIAERDERIAALEAQVAEASRNAEAAERLRAEIAELRAQGESDRVDFGLKLAGCRNVKAARAILGDHGDDIEKLKAEEPWLFVPGVPGVAGAGGGAGAGATGLPNAGAASDEGRALRHWREVAGLVDSEKKGE